MVPERDLAASWLPKSWRTVSLSLRIAVILEKLVAGKVANDFVSAAPVLTVMVELSSIGTGVVYNQVQLRVGARRSQPFRWATVSVGAIEEVATRAELVVTDLTCISQRHVATLRHRSQIERSR